MVNFLSKVFVGLNLYDFSLENFATFDFSHFGPMKKRLIPSADPSFLFKKTCSPSTLIVSLQGVTRRSITSSFP